MGHNSFTVCDWTAGTILIDQMQYLHDDVYLLDVRGAEMAIHSGLDVTLKYAHKHAGIYRVDVTPRARSSTAAFAASVNVYYGSGHRLTTRFIRMEDAERWAAWVRANGYAARKQVAQPIDAGPPSSVEVPVAASAGV